MSSTRSNRRDLTERAVAYAIAEAARDGYLDRSLASYDLAVADAERFPGGALLTLTDGTFVRLVIEPCAERPR